MKLTSRARMLGLLGLCLGFYAFALAIAGALFWLPWAQARYQHELGLTGILCALAGGWLLFGLLPLPSRFTAPGKPLSDAEHPRLRALMEDVARRAGERAPEHIYLVPEATAFTSVHRKWLGLSRKRVVGVGLPLLSTMSRDELAAVVAHELGHHLGGDLRIKPWIAATRRALTRTLDNLDDSLLWLHLPFIWYARWFLRRTFEISREQELAADALAARIVGPETTAAALTKVHEISPQWSVYWEQEVIPVLSQGKRPPLLEGFQIFRREALAQSDLAEAFAQARERATSEHDTHPSLRDRLIALAAAPAPTAQGEPAWDLLDRHDDVEGRALLAVMEPDAIEKLEPLPWEDVPRTLFIPLWRGELKPHQGVLADLQIRELRNVLAERAVWAERLRRGVAVLSTEAQSRRLIGLLGTWLSLELVDKHGFAIDTLPGRPLLLTRGEHVIEPHKLVEALAKGRCDSEFSALCDALAMTTAARAFTDREPQITSA